MKSTFCVSYVLFALIFFGCGNSEILDDKAIEIVKKFNSKCPLIVDSETRVDGIEIKKPNTIVYKYTLVNLLVESVDTSAFSKALRPGIISTLKTNSDLKDLKDNNAIFEYSYKDKKNRLIYLFKVTSKDYKP